MRHRSNVQPFLHVLERQVLCCYSSVFNLDVILSNNKNMLKYFLLEQHMACSTSRSLQQHCGRHLLFAKWCSLSGDLSTFETVLTISLTTAQTLLVLTNLVSFGESASSPKFYFVMFVCQCTRFCLFATHLVMLMINNNISLKHVQSFQVVQILPALCCPREQHDWGWSCAVPN